MNNFENRCCCAQPIMPSAGKYESCCQVVEQPICFTNQFEHFHKIEHVVPVQIKNVHNHINQHDYVVKPQQSAESLGYEQYLSTPQQVAAQAQQLNQTVAMTQNQLGQSQMPMMQQGQVMGQMPMMQQGQVMGQMPMMQQGQMMGQMPMMQQGQMMGQMPMMQQGQVMGQKPTTQQAQVMGQKPTTQQAQMMGQKPMMQQPWGCVEKIQKTVTCPGM
ncbi:MAG TPA: hypothetical protein DCY20_00315 [Firmicutes bacterium]|nr:hypothetical protein [Bacillota bacterium]